MNRSKQGSIPSYVALLRGINVGGKNMLPMSALMTLFTRAGGSDVRTYIQSGNVLFRTEPKLAQTIAVLVKSEIAAEFGLNVPVILRTSEQMQEVAKENPFLQTGLDQKALHILFLDTAPSAALADTLDPKRSVPDEFRVRGSEIYLYLPNGAGRTKLTNAYFDSKLSATSTGRNWATVCKLVEMMSE